MCYVIQKKWSSREHKYFGERKNKQKKPLSALKKVVKIPLQMQRDFKEPLFQVRTMSLSKEWQTKQTKISTKHTKQPVKSVTGSWQPSVNKRRKKF